MRRPLAIFLLAAFLLLPTVPAFAAAAPIDPQTTGSKARIDAFVAYMNNGEKWMDVPVNSPGNTFELPKGLYPYVDTWVSVFNRERYGSINLSDMAPGAPGSTDYTRGESVGNWLTYCGKYKDFLLKIQEMAGRIMTGANSTFADAETQKKLGEIMLSLDALAQRAMSVTLATGGNTEVHGNQTCANTIANIYYSFANPLAGYSSACIANVLSDPAKDPANSSGVCVFRKRNTISIATMPGCTTGSGCTSKVVTSCSSNCVWYDFKGRKAKLDANLKMLDDALAEQEKKLVEVSSALAKAGADADKTKAELLARGTALSLPLPLSDITIEKVVANALNALMGIIGAIALLMFVWGGIQWMTAAGNQDQVGKAKKTITWAALGLIAIFSSYAVINLVIETFAK